jgi:DNA-binding transcriptional LysR family regulator
MTIKQLHYFISVAETRSFTHAARNYFIAQTAMSQQISAMEKELGFRLFHRTNRTVELTEAGRVLFQRVRPLILDLEESIQAASAVAGVANQLLRIGLSDQAVNRFLVPALTELRKAEPEVTPLLMADDHHRILEALSQGAMDLAVLGSGHYTRHAMLTATELFRYQVLEYVLAVPKSAPLAEETQLEWAQLEGLQLVAYSPLRENQNGDQLRALLAEHSVQADIRCSTRSVDTALLYVEAGMGCCLLPAYVAEHWNREIAMVPVASQRRDTMLLVHHKDTENPLVGEFLGICRRTLKGT